MNLIIILGYKLKQFSFHSTGKEAKESPEWDGADSRLHSWQHFIKSDAIQNECVKKQLNPNKIFSLVTVVVFQSLSHVQLSVTPWIAACQTLLSFTISWSFLKLMSTESTMLSNHHSLCCPFLLLPSIFTSMRVFSIESVLHIKCPKVLELQLHINSSNEYPGLIFFRIDWFDLLAGQGTLKSLFQHHSLKAWIFWHSAFFIVQLSHPYMTTGKTIALTIWTLSVKWCLCFVTCCLGLSSFPSKEQASFIFTSEDTIHSAFGVQENKLYYCFHFPLLFATKWWD